MESSFPGRQAACSAGYGNPADLNGRAPISGQRVSGKRNLAASQDRCEKSHEKEIILPQSREISAWGAVRQVLVTQ
jgi:hypothetical protein